MQEFNRRQFIATASVLAVAPGSIIQSEDKNSTQLIHHVFFWLKKPGLATDRQLLIEGLKTLAEIKTVKKLLIGTAAPTEQRGVVDNTYDVSELMFFDNIEGQNVYQVHAIHKAFVEKYSHLWEKVIVYDMQVI